MLDLLTCPFLVQKLKKNFMNNQPKQLTRVEEVAIFAEIAADSNTPREIRRELLKTIIGPYINELTQYNI